MILSNALDAQLASIARTPVLLVASDFDGVLAPIVDDPTDVIADPRSMASLRQLSKLERTPVALVSGRSLDFLRQLNDLPDPLWLAGSHGAELSHHDAVPIAPDRLALLARLVTDLEHLATHAPGARVETKQGSVAFHYREVDPALVPRLRSDVIDGPAALPGVEVKHGKMVIELAVFVADKGRALEQLRSDLEATAVLYLGDDITDEDAFAVLGDGDLSIKVGAGTTKADHRIGDTDSVTEVLTRLLELRTAS